MKDSIPMPTSSMALAVAWKKYLQTGEINANTIKPLVAASWQRCQESRVDPFGGVCRHVLDSSELRYIQQKNEMLLRMTIPLMEYYYQLVKGSGVVFVLIDTSGYVLKIFGDPKILDSAKEINFMPGASWTEKDVGTNAIGTSLVTQKPVHVTAVEHYCQFHHSWACSAAPIFEAEGNLAGIIDVSGPSAVLHVHTLGIAAAIANSLTMKFLMTRMEQDLRLQDTRVAGIFKHTSDGIMEVDRNGVVTHANTALCILFQRSQADIVGRPLTELLKHNAPELMTVLGQHECVNYECSLPTKHGRRKYLLNGESLVSPLGTSLGRLILFKPLIASAPLITRKNAGQPGPKTYTFADVIGKHPAILEAKQLAELAAPNMARVLLQGECGTGKEIFAQAIHHQSPHSGGPFVAVNCGAIPKELIGSELFGYEDGAFTGAKRGGNAGKFEQAGGGTLFLDEIGEMPPEQQVALLRVLQEHKVTRIGGRREIPVNVRIICATNKNLSSEVAHKRFREDLYYRLNVISIHIPPLRERKNDILLLFTHFLQHHELIRGVTFTIEPAVFECLQHYHWPGNVRELRNVVERAASLSQDRIIRVKNLPPEILMSGEHRFQEPDMPAAYESLLATREDRKQEKSSLEKQQIIYALDKCYGNVSRAARELGISRNTLYRKMHLYEIVN